jgi:large subunit ribosomal protein L17
MRHRKKINRLGRATDHRKALLRNLATSLALHQKLTTTTAKARSLKAYFERLVALVKKQDDQNAIKTLKTRLFTVKAQKSLFNVVRKLEGGSGWLRLTKVGLRDGDKAEMTQIEFK